MLGTFILIIFIVYLTVNFLQKRQKRKARLSYIDNFQFPDTVYKRIHEKYPHLGEDHINQVISSLKTYFALCGESPSRMISMPSQVTDVAWHEFILFTRRYEEFCMNAVGRFLHHTPAEAMKTPIEAQDGIRLTWQLACEHEGINPRSPSRLPLLFAIDTFLEIPDGFCYVLDCFATDDKNVLAGDSPAGQRVPYCAAHIRCGGGGGCGGCGGCGGGG